MKLLRAADLGLMAPCEDQRDDILLGREGVVKMAV